MNLRNLFLAVGVLATLLFVEGCQKRGDPLTATRAFFALIAAGKTREAYESSAFAFQAQQSLKAFETTAKEQALASFVDASWDPPEITGRTAKIRGEATNAGRKIALIVTLNNESAGWRIFSVRTPRNLQTGMSANLFGAVGKTAGFTEAIDRPLPDEKTVHTMALETMLMFNESVQEKSFDQFYEKISKTWQKQLTIGQLTRAFNPFIDAGVNIAGIKDVEPVFDEAPQITSEGLLIIGGHYPTTPYRVVFALRFIYELPKWKLFGIDVTLRKQAG